MNATHITHPRTFRTFVTSPQNALAYNAALTVAHAPGTVYNPLFLAGGTGVGKTHLLHAISAYLARHLNGAEPIMITGEAFATEFDAHLRHGAMAAFRRRYRRASALLLDGVAVLASHLAAAEELVRTLAIVQEANRQIVIADAHRPPALRGLPPRLATHLGCSLVVTLHMPDEATRLAILRQIAMSWHLSLADDVLTVLASQVRDSGHDLEPVVARLAAETAWGWAMTPARAAAVARKITGGARQARGQVQVEAVLRAVCAYYGLGRPVLLGKSRELVVAQARHIAMYLLREDAGLTATQVGRALRRDHSTVLHGHGRVAQALAAGDPVLTAALDHVRRGVLRDRCA